jgi:hypothetical protein
MLLNCHSTVDAQQSMSSVVTRLEITGMFPKLAQSMGFASLFEPDLPSLSLTRIGELGRTVKSTLLNLHAIF